MGPTEKNYSIYNTSTDAIDDDSEGFVNRSAQDSMPQGKKLSMTCRLSATLCQKHHKP